MTDAVPWFLIWSLVSHAWQQHRHIRSLRRQLGPDAIDAWPLRCEGCARRVRSGHVLLCVADYAPTGDRAAYRRVRAWHADRPKCSAAFATDTQVMDTYLNGDIPS